MNNPAETAPLDVAPQRTHAVKDNQQLFASRYLSVLPSGDELQRERERRNIEQQIKDR